MEPKTVLTMIPDDEYEGLYQRVKEKGKYSEVLWPDKVATEMWIANGKLMSRMKGELLIKQIIPNSQMPKMEKNWKPNSGFSKAVQFIMKRDNLPFNVVSDMMVQLYREYKIPKEVSLPQELLDSLRIEKVKASDLDLKEE